MNWTIIWMIMFFVILIYAIWNSEDWHKNCKKLNKDWYKLAMKSNEEWAELCRKIEAERDALKARVTELEKEIKQ